MNTGWICPRCNVVHAPSVLRCECKAVEKTESERCRELFDEFRRTFGLPGPSIPKRDCQMPGYRYCKSAGPEECPVFCPLSAKRAGEQANPQMGDCRCPTGHLCSESAWACPRRFGPPSTTTAGNAGEPT